MQHLAARCALGCQTRRRGERSVGPWLLSEEGLAPREAFGPMRAMLTSTLTLDLISSWLRCRTCAMSGEASEDGRFPRPARLGDSL